MRWHYDVTGAEPILRDIPVYAAAALTRDTAMCSGAVATEVNNGRAIVAAPTVLSNIIGVLQEDVTAAKALAVLATGYENYAKHIINPFAVWFAKYSQLTADLGTTNAADTTGKTVTAADTGAANQTGYWVYISSLGGTLLTGGYGNLFCVGAATGTTVMTAVTDYDDHLNGNIVGDRFIAMYPRYGATAVGGSVNLATNCIDVAGTVATAATGSAIVLENYIAQVNGPMEPLVIKQHSGNVYKNSQFYADLMFSEHLCACGGVVNNRVIT
jgi:hypothetical protein